MKKRQIIKPVLLALAIAVVAPYVPASRLSYTALAEDKDKYHIILNGKVLETNNPIQNINDRILLPFREIGEAMGATVDWDDVEKKITAFKDNRYSIMTLGSTLLTYGEYSSDGGNIIYDTETSAFLPVAPVIINDWAYIPVRNIAEALGAEVDWDKDTNTATITSKKVEPTPSPSPSPTPTPTPISTAVESTTYFKISTSKSINTMYSESKTTPFIFVLYDGDDTSSNKIVKEIQEAAADAKVTIYGVDTDDKSYDTDYVQWLWDSSRKEKDFKTPTVYYVHSKTKITENQAPTNMTTLKKEISDFNSGSSSSSKGDFKDTTYFKTKTDSEIKDKYNKSAEFILAFYDSTDDDSKNYIAHIKEGAEENKTVVYGLDVNEYPKFYNSMSFTKDQEIDENLPILYLMYEDSDDIKYYTQPTSLSKVNTIIKEFNKNSKSSSKSNFTTVKSGSYYLNSNISKLTDKYDDGEDSFMVILYNSSDDSTKEEDILRIKDIIEEDYRDHDYYYGLDEATIDTKNLRNDYDWLYSNISSNAKYPAIICFYKGSFEKALTDATSKSKIEDFLEQYGR